MSKVFIGMPAYNGERFIKEAIDSLVCQTFVDWTLFISDDASTDSTRKIIEEYCCRDSRIVYYRQKRNLGLFANFGFTLERASGLYFMWAAQDDLWDKSYLEVCVDNLDKDASLGLTSTSNAAIDSFGRTIHETPWMVELSGQPSVKQVAKYIMQAESLGKCNLMYGLFRLEAVRATWQAYPQRSVWGQDYMFSLAAVARFGVLVDGRILFKKRLGGYSSPQLSLEDSSQKVRDINISDAKNHMFPFGRFGIYYSGHREALRHTPYWFLAGLLFLRLPRSLLIHIRQRSVKNLIRNTLVKFNLF